MRKVGENECFLFPAKCKSQTQSFFVLFGFFFFLLNMNAQFWVDLEDVTQTGQFWCLQRLS